MRFTPADFLSTTAGSVRETRKRPERTNILPGKLRFPVAPPSPLFDGANEEINTEPFPSFDDAVDLDPIEAAGPVHCMLHCHHKVCKRTVYEHLELSCWCAFEKPEEQSLFTRFRPVIEIDDLAMETLPDIKCTTDLNYELDIYIEDVQTLLPILKNHVAARVALNRFRVDIVQHRPAELTTEVLTDVFFDDISMYFNRTLHGSGHRVLSVRRLQEELEFFVQTMGLPNSRTPDNASVFWYRCVDDLVGLMIWRHGKIRRFKDQVKALLVQVGYTIFSLMTILVCYLLLSE